MTREIEYIGPSSAATVTTADFQAAGVMDQTTVTWNAGNNWEVTVSDLAAAFLLANDPVRFRDGAGLDFGSLVTTAPRTFNRPDLFVDELGYWRKKVMAAGPLAAPSIMYLGDSWTDGWASRNNWNRQLTSKLQEKWSEYYIPRTSTAAQTWGFVPAGRDNTNVYPSWNGAQSSPIPDMDYSAGIACNSASLGPGEWKEHTFVGTEFLLWWSKQKVGGATFRLTVTDAADNVLHTQDVDTLDAGLVNDVESGQVIAVLNGTISDGSLTPFEMTVRIENIDGSGTAIVDGGYFFPQSSYIGSAITGYNFGLAGHRADKVLNTTDSTANHIARNGYYYGTMDYIDRLTANSPALVVLLFGTNDYANDYTAHAAFQANLEAIVDVIQGQHPLTSIMLCSPMWQVIGGDSGASWANWDAAVVAAAASRGCAYHLFNDHCPNNMAGDPLDYWTGGAAHPLERAFTLMADSLFQVLG